MATPFAVMIIRALFPEDCSKHVMRVCQVFPLMYIILLFFLDFRAAEHMMRIFFVSLGVVIVYSLHVFIKAMLKKRDDAVLFFMGFMGVFLTSVNDTLYATWVINTTNATQYGLVGLSIAGTIVISRRFARALRKVEYLSADLTEKNLSLQKLDRIKDQLLANTSHELRTPLHGMIGLSESMIQGAAGDLSPKALENLSLIASSGHRLASLVSDILDMAKLQEGGIHLNLRPVDLYALSSMVVNLSLPLVGGKPLQIINGIRPDTPAVCADEDRVRQVLYNLIGNAVKFTNSGRIELSARVLDQTGTTVKGARGNMVEVCVSDTGIGIPDEYREKIFEAYQQVDGSETRAYSGTGLGLAIAKKIIELHDGTVRVASGTGGSVFCFSFPMSNEPALEALDKIIIEGMDDVLPADGPPERSRLPAGVSESAFDNNPVFLVVDDDPVNVRVIQNLFEPRKCVVKTAADGMSAIQIIEKGGPIDLVLLDIMMPVMSGYDVCKRIRLSCSPEELPVIMLTAKNMFSDIDAAFEAGANDYIVKPFHINELVARVSTMLKLRKVRRSAAEGITIRDRNSIYSIKFKDIIHITSHLKNISVHTEQKDIEVPVSMKEIGDRLPPDMFVRIHKSHIINIRYLRSVSHVLSGRYRVRLGDRENTELPVGPAFLEPLRKKM